MLEPTESSKAVNTDQLSQVVDLLEGGGVSDGGDQHKPDEKPAGDVDTPVDEEAGSAVEASDSEPESLEESEEPTPTAPSLKDLADRLQIDQAELYSVQIPLPGDGESISLGELKDQFNEFSVVEKRAEKLNEEKVAYENDKLRSYQELQTLVNLLPEVPEQYRSQAAQMQQQHLQTEQARLLEVLPEWKDANNFEAGRSAINGLAGEYGFSPAETAGISDHRLVKLLKDFADMKTIKTQAEEAAQKIVKPPKAPAKPAPKVNKMSELEARAKRGDQSAAIDLVSQLVGAIR